jgi:predicted unusual protein kinase regulating ubiquinone biosynthesis (AarF/ABC1/UbiB family)
MIITELGGPPEELFASFNTKAFAAASLGQVHTATTHDGETLAVKIQYPGISDTIDSDIRMIKGLVRPLQKSNIMLEGLKEIRARLVEETDYALEAENLNWFRKHLQINKVRIPKVYENLSTNKVLSMEKLPGVHLKDWLETDPSIDERNHFGGLIGKTFRRSFYELKILHADPNPGNYLFGDDGNLALLDFGCVKRFSEDFSTHFLSLMDAHIRNSKTDVLAAYKAFGLLDDITAASAAQLYEDVLKPLGDWLLKAVHPEHFDFAKNKGYASEGICHFEKMMHHPGFQQTNTEFIFLDRTIFGLYSLYEQMGASVSFKIPVAR